jgi:hypothetical protein
MGKTDVNKDCISNHMRNITIQLALCAGFDLGEWLIATRSISSAIPKHREPFITAINA